MGSEDGPEARIEAVIVTGAGTERSTVLAGLALALHAGRSGSPASELEAIEAILAANRTGGEASTIKAIADARRRRGGDARRGARGRT